jgi:BirA family biotin operon repressor/biotin-[acetyl-CoA-carboxylase] ligase
MGKREQLVRLLADGEVHSGVAMARAMHCSRTAVWKHLRELRNVGLDVAAMPGRGYQLTRPLELLDRTSIVGGLPGRVRKDLGALEIFGIVESTSNHLRAAPAPPPGKLHAALAEYQTGGRGRRGRRWLSPYGSGLCLSVSWSFALVPPTLSAFSLAAGVAVHRALAAFEPAGLGLKWPNDIVAGNRKLGGLLVDVEGESSGPMKVVVGVGVNIDVSDDLESEIAAGDSWPPVGLRDLILNVELSRNAVASSVINELHAALVEFADVGFSGFIEEWQRYDKLLGKRVCVRTGARNHIGIASGIGSDGTLALRVNGETVSLNSGEVSLRSEQSSGLGA